MFSRLIKVWINAWRVVWISYVLNKCWITIYFFSVGVECNPCKWDLKCKAVRFIAKDSFYCSWVYVCVCVCVCVCVFVCVCVCLRVGHHDVRIIFIIIWLHGNPFAPSHSISSVVKCFCRQWKFTLFSLMMPHTYYLQINKAEIIT